MHYKRHACAGRGDRRVRGQSAASAEHPSVQTRIFSAIAVRAIIVVLICGDVIPMQQSRHTGISPNISLNNPLDIQLMIWQIYKTAFAAPDLLRFTKLFYFNIRRRSKATKLFLELQCLTN